MKIESKKELPYSIKKYLESVKKRIIKEINPEKIILFGSYARGDYNKDSDIDLLFVVNDGIESIRNIKYKIEDELSDRIFPLDILVYTKEKLEDEKDIVGTLSYHVKKEGQIIYVKNQ